MSRIKEGSIYPGASLPLLYAHRGYSARAPENTLAAFDLARSAGIPGIELDVHRCMSGELVVIHDHDLKRLTGQTGTVEEETWERLSKLDAGVWKGENFRGERIPLMAEVFDLVGVSMYYDIEIKSRGDEPGPLETQLVELIRARRLSEHCIISSFDPRTIALVKRLAPEIPTAIIYSGEKWVPVGLRPGQGRFTSRCDFLKPHHAKVAPVPQFLNHSLMSYPVITWTVDDAELASRCLAFSATGLISNDPGPLLKLVEAKKPATV